MPRYTPKELYDNYRKGFSGCIWEQHLFDHLMETSKYPLFGDASKKVSGTGKGKLSTPYKSVLKFDKNPYINSLKIIKRIVKLSLKFKTTHLIWVLKKPL